MSSRDASDGWLGRLGVGVTCEVGQSSGGLVRKRGGVPVLIDAQRRAQGILGLPRRSGEPVYLGFGHQYPRLERCPGGR